MALAVVLLAGCGGEDFKNEARAPIRLELSGVIQDDEVTVSPAKLGAGPVAITISNQTDVASLDHARGRLDGRPRRPGRAR